jgi:hypothetical protein
MEHLVVQALLDGGTVGCYSSVYMEAISLNEGWCKEGKSLYVIPVGVGEKHVSFYRHLR